jgi:hypothetical protein
MHSPLTPDWSRHTEPFLSVGVQGELSVMVVETSASSSPPGQLSLWKSVIDLQTGRGAPWEELRFGPGHPPDVVLPLAGPHLTPSASLPADVARHLASMRAAPDSGTVLAIAPDIRHAITGSNDRVCVWSLEDVRRSWCEPRAYQTYEFFDTTHVWVGGQRTNQLERGIWDIAARSLSTRSFPPETSIAPGTGDQFLAYVLNPSTHLYDFEVWKFTSDTPSWGRQGCPSRPHFASGGAQVVCPTVEYTEQPVMLLDAANGRVINEKAPPPERQHLPEPCDVGVELDGQTITRNGRAVAAVFDLTPSEWAIALPDGQFEGTPDASAYLAFYGPSGTLLGSEQVQRLHNASAVQSAMRAMRDAIGGCKKYGPSSGGAGTRPRSGPLARLRIAHAQWSSHEGRDASHRR